MPTVVLCGMPSEKRILSRALPGVLVLSGTDKLQLPQLVPPDCTRIVSMGLCGGLSPELAVPDVAASVRIIVTTTTKKVSCVGYVRDPAAGPRQGYVSVARLRTERETASEALTAELARVQSILERAKELAAGLELDADFHELLAGAMELSSRMRRGLAVPDEGPSPIH